MEKTYELFNWLINEFGYQSYLEIGCKDNSTFDRVKVAKKVGVDPNRGGTLRMTSDQYFKDHNDTFDLVFVDRLHEHEQAVRDVENSLLRLNQGGTIVMHDCDPPSEERQRVPQGNQRGWCGDVWKGYLQIRTRPDLDVACTTFDMGMGIIRVRPNSAILTLPKQAKEMTWADLEADRAALLRQFPEEQLLQWIKDPNLI